MSTRESEADKNPSGQSLCRKGHKGDIFPVSHLSSLIYTRNISQDGGPKGYTSKSGTTKSAGKIKEMGEPLGRKLQDASYPLCVES